MLEYFLKRSGYIGKSFVWWRKGKKHALASKSSSKPIQIWWILGQQVRISPKMAPNIKILSFLPYYFQNSLPKCDMRDDVFSWVMNICTHARYEYYIQNESNVLQWEHDAELWWLSWLIRWTGQETVYVVRAGSGACIPAHKIFFHVFTFQSSSYFYWNWIAVFRKNKAEKKHFFLPFAHFLPKTEFLLPGHLFWIADYS